MNRASKGASVTIILKAARTDDARTGYVYSVGRLGEVAATTTDVVEATRMLEEMGVERAPDAVDQARARGIVHIKQR